MKDNGERVLTTIVYLSGNYIPIFPDNDIDLNDMLKTSGLGLNKDDTVFIIYQCHSCANLASTHCVSFRSSP